MKCFNYKDDFLLQVAMPNVCGAPTGVPDFDFELRFRSQFSEYLAGCKNGEFYNCHKGDKEDELVVIFNNHNLSPCSNLLCDITYRIPDPSMPDGVRTVIRSYKTGVALVTQPPDCKDDCECKAEFEALLPYIKGKAGLSAYEQALQGGYDGTLEEFQTKLANVGGSEEFKKFKEEYDETFQKLVEFQDGVSTNLNELNLIVGKYLIDGDFKEFFDIYIEDELTTQDVKYIADNGKVIYLMRSIHGVTGRITSGYFGTLTYKGIEYKFVPCEEYSDSEGYPKEGIYYSVYQKKYYILLNRYGELKELPPSLIETLKKLKEDFEYIKEDYQDFYQRLVDWQDAMSNDYTEFKNDYLSFYQRLCDWQDAMTTDYNEFKTEYYDGHQALADFQDHVTGFLNVTYPTDWQKICDWQDEFTTDYNKFIGTAVTHTPSDEEFEDIEPGIVTNALRKTEQLLTPEEKTQVKKNLSISKMELLCDRFNQAAGNSGHASINENNEFECELYGLTLTYEEALTVDRESSGGNHLSDFLHTASTARTFYPIKTGRGSFTNDSAHAFAKCTNLEILKFDDSNYVRLVSGALLSCNKLRRIIDGLCIVYSTELSNLPALEYVKFAMRGNVDLSKSPKLEYKALLDTLNSTESSYLSTAKTLTVHPDVFAKLTDESNEEWHSLIALAQSKNITFATV